MTTLLALAKKSKFNLGGTIVTRIGADSLYDANQKSYYQIEVEINEKSVKNKNNEMVILRPGMTGIARIIVKRQKLISVILSKLDFL